MKTMIIPLFAAVVLSWTAPEPLLPPAVPVAVSGYRIYLGTNETNWLTNNAWEVLSYGALIETTAYTKDKEMVPYWQTKYKEAFLDQLKSEIAEVDAGNIPYIESAY